jgi:hypothetical protein
MFNTVLAVIGSLVVDVRCPVIPYDSPSSDHSPVCSHVSPVGVWSPFAKGDGRCWVRSLATYDDGDASGMTSTESLRSGVISHLGGLTHGSRHHSAPSPILTRWPLATKMTMT